MVTLRARTRTTDVARRAMINCGLPLPKGFLDPAVHPKGVGIQATSGEWIYVEPYGSLWNDGTARYARATCPVDVAVNTGEGSQSFGAYTIGSPPAGWLDSQLFTLHPWIQKNSVVSDPYRFDFNVEGQYVPFVPIESRSTPYYRYYRFRAHHEPSGIWADLDLWVWHNLPYASFVLFANHSTQNAPQFTKNLMAGAYAIVSRAYPNVHAIDRKTQLHQVGQGPVWGWQVIPAGDINEGMGQEFRGTLVFADWENLLSASPVADFPTAASESISSVFSIADNWYNSLGHVKWFESFLRLNEREIREWMWGKYYRSNFRTGHWFDPPFTATAAAGQAGDNPDHAAVGPLPIQAAVHLNEPLILEALEPSICQEACRPIWYRQQDGEFIDAAGTEPHPNLFYEKESIHWSRSVSPDRLGRPANISYPTWNGNGWTGRDHDHHTLNHWFGFALLTADHTSARRWRIFPGKMAKEFLLPGEPGPNGSTSTTLHNIRASGSRQMRWTRSAAQVDHIIGGSEASDRAVAWWNDVALPYWNANVPTGTPLQAFRIEPADPRLISNERSVVFFQNCLFVMSYANLEQHVGRNAFDPQIVTRMTELVKSMVINQMAFDSTVGWRHAYTLPWRNGQGDAVTNWPINQSSLPQLQAALSWGTLRGLEIADTALSDRCVEIAAWIYANRPRFIVDLGDQAQWNKWAAEYNPIPLVRA